MNSCLNIYIKREYDEAPIIIGSWPSNSTLYKRFSEKIKPIFSPENKFHTEIDVNDLVNLICDIKEEIKYTERKLDIHRQYAQTNSEYIEDILSETKYIEDLIIELGGLFLLKQIVNSQNLSDHKVLCNIN